MIKNRREINPSSDVDKIEWDCVICDEKYRPNFQYHECDPKKLSRFNAGKKAAETRIENNGYWFLELNFAAALEECAEMFKGRI